MQTIRRSTLALSVILLAAACADAPTAAPPTVRASGADRMTWETTYDLTGSTYYFSCDANGNVVDGEGEVVRLEGGITERVSVVNDPVGGSHYRFQETADGLRGIGEDSGEEFRVRDREHGVGNAMPMSDAGHYRRVVELVGRDTKRAFKIVYGGHWTINANGELVIDRFYEHVECRR